MIKTFTLAGLFVAFNHCSALAQTVAGIAPELEGNWSVACENGPASWRQFKDGKAIGPGDFSLTVKETRRQGDERLVVFSNGSSELFIPTVDGLRYLQIRRSDGSIAKTYSVTLRKCDNNSTGSAQKATQLAATPATTPLPDQNIDDVYKYLYSLKTPTTHTYAINANQYGITIKKLIRSSTTASIYIENNDTTGVIHTTSMVCVSPGFFKCNNWGSFLYYMRTNGYSYNLSEISGFRIKESALAELREAIYFESARQARDGGRAKYLLTQLTDLLKGYESGRLKTVDSDDTITLKLTDLSSRGFSLVFPFNGGSLKSFDLIEGGSGNWNFHDVTVPDFSEEEEALQRKTVTFIQGNKAQIAALGADKLQELINRHQRLPRIARELTEIQLSKARSIDDPLTYVTFINKNTADRSAAEAAMEKLRAKLSADGNPDVYMTVIDKIDGKAPGIVNIANDFAKLLWRKQIKPSEDVNVVMGFMNQFGGASSDLIAEAFQYALDLESKKLRSKYDAMLRKNSGMSEFMAQERVARSLFVEASQAKEAGNDIAFAVKYHVAVNDSLLKESEAAFNLYRDRDMKSFFKEQFDKITKSHYDASEKIVESVSSLHTALQSIAENTKAAPTDQSEIDSQTQRFLLQSYLFDKTYRDKR